MENLSQIFTLCRFPKVFNLISDFDFDFFFFTVDLQFKLFSMREYDYVFLIMLVHSEVFCQVV